MGKHHIDIFLERETKLLQQIQDYFEELIDGEYECFKAFKAPDGSYYLNLSIGVLHIARICINITINEVYEKASKIQHETLEEIIEQYLRERLAEEISYIFEHMDDPDPEDDTMQDNS